jgi:hypothetical protein
MWYYYVAIVLLVFWALLLRPRRAGSNIPLVTESKLFGYLPFVGVLSEFLKSPNDMMKRCVADYGSVFTIPVCCYVLCLCYECRDDDDFSLTSSYSLHPLLLSCPPLHFFFFFF